MCIRIIGDKLIRDSKASIIRIQGRVLKIPFSLSAIREIKKEKKLIQAVKKDKHFSSYLLDYKYFLGIQCTPYLTTFNEHPDRFSSLIRQYFKLSFQDSLAWRYRRLKDLIKNEYYFKFISQYFPNHCECWHSYLSSVKVPQSSAHGDFYPDNILVQNNRLYFIDWIRYNPVSSRYFDLIDFYILSRKLPNQSWMDVWLQEYNFKRDEIWRIRFPSEFFLAYAVWKMAEELKTLYLRRRLDKHKIKKYTNFIKVLTSLICKD